MKVLGHQSVGWNIFVVVLSVAGLMSSMSRLKMADFFLESPAISNQYEFVSIVLWLCILTSSIVCCYLYFIIFKASYRTIYRVRASDPHFYRSMGLSLLIFLLSCVATVSLYCDMVVWRQRVQEKKLLLIQVYNVLFYIRMVQRIFSCKLKGERERERERESINFSPIIESYHFYSPAGMQSLPAGCPKIVLDHCTCTCTYMYSV